MPFCGSTVRFVQLGGDPEQAQSAPEGFYIISGLDAPWELQRTAGGCGKQFLQDLSWTCSSIHLEVTTKWLNGCVSSVPFTSLDLVNNPFSIPPVQKCLQICLYIRFFFMARHVFLQAAEKKIAPPAPKIVPLSQSVQLRNPPWRRDIWQQSSGTNIRIKMPEFKGGRNRIRLRSTIVDGEWQRGLRKKGHVSRGCHIRAITQGL